MLSFFLAVHPEVELLDHMAYLGFLFKNNRNFPWPSETKREFIGRVVEASSIYKGEAEGLGLDKGTRATGRPVARQ